MSEEYTQAEAQTLVGKRFESRIQYGNLPRGTNGRVVAAAKVRDQWEVVVAFETRMESPRVHCSKLSVIH